MYSTHTYANIAKYVVPAVYNGGPRQCLQQCARDGLLSISDADDRWDWCQLGEPAEHQFVAFSRASLMDQHEQRHHRFAQEHSVSVQETGDIKVSHTESGVIVHRALRIPVQLHKVIEHGRQTDNGTKVVPCQLEYMHIVRLKQSTTASECTNCPGCSLFMSSHEWMYSCSM